MLRNNKKMVDWKAAVRTWAKNQKKFSTNVSFHGKGQDNGSVASMQANVVVEAIGKVGIYGHVNFENLITAEAVRRIGWENLCHKNTRFVKNDFMDMYKRVEDER